MRSSRFVKSATRKDQYPASDLPQIAFVGRSNVGKSSLLNCLVGRKSLARISSTPGRTQLINFFEVDSRFLFVDLPGYGYARVPAKVQSRWRPMIEEYLAENPRLALTVSIVDGRHPPTELDQMLIEWLQELEIPFQIVATKMDKVKKNQRKKSIQTIQEVLGTHRVLPFSATTGRGKKELWNIIESAISTAGGSLRTINH